MSKLLLKPEEVAESLDLSRSRVYQMIAAEELPVVLIGGHYRVYFRDLRQWVQERRRPAGAADRSRKVSA